MGLLHTIAAEIKNAGGYKGSVSDAVTDARPILAAFADWVEQTQILAGYNGMGVAAWEIADVIREAAQEQKR